MKDLSKFETRRTAAAGQPLAAHDTSNRTGGVGEGGTLGCVCLETLDGTLGW